MLRIWKVNQGIVETKSIYPAQPWHSLPRQGCLLISLIKNWLLSQPPLAWAPASLGCLGCCGPGERKSKGPGLGAEPWEPALHAAGTEEPFTFSCVSRHQPKLPLNEEESHYFINRIASIEENLSPV